MKYFMEIRERERMEKKLYEIFAELESVQNMGM